MTLPYTHGRLPHVSISHTVETCDSTVYALPHVSTASLSCATSLYRERLVAQESQAVETCEREAVETCGTRERLVASLSCASLSCASLCPSIVYIYTQTGCCWRMQQRAHRKEHTAWSQGTARMARQGERGSPTEVLKSRKRQSSSHGHATPPLTFESFYLTLPPSLPLSFARATSKGPSSSEAHAP